VRGAWKALVVLVPLTFDEGSPDCLYFFDSPVADRKPMWGCADRSSFRVGREKLCRGPSSGEPMKSLSRLSGSFSTQGLADWYV